MLTDLDTRTVGSLASRISSSPSTIYLRAVSTADNLANPWIEPISEGKSLMFFKWFDPKVDSLLILGSMPIDRDLPISTIVPLVKERMAQLGIEYEGNLAVFEVKREREYLLYHNLLNKCFVGIQAIENC